ncbi:hypothetical protein K488DRAFT_76307 [Vararia minispora EC-137]|uniref:Uncharacterized protein n=1 Tax=Vararia minispora EC-137 TaxID=1314806 RepID=A0ACB8QWH8_9AGAM|nr:hypothetical protein K488DRAFT_76307 [Vararia minispora EC-137]
MPSKLYVPTLIVGMIATGACNSLFSKYQDMQCVENCSDLDPSKHVLYEQPFWQTLQMFRFLPVVATYAYSRLHPAPLHLPADREDAQSTEPLLDTDGPPKPAPLQLSGYRILLLWLPAFCDLTGTTLMNIGLLYTPVSIYQMTRGALVLFVGILSVLFLHRRLWIYQWLSLVIVMAGVSLVGYSGSLIKDTLHEAVNLVSRALAANASDVPVEEPIEKPEATKVVVGVFFILFAQIFSATQFVVEEKILSHYTIPPLLAVGYEGFFGALSIVILLPLLPLISVPPSSPAAAWLDLPRGWAQLVNTPTVLWSGLLVALSISFFNFFGLSVTKYVSATARSLTDTCRTLAIWIVSVLIGWEILMWPVSVLQVLGFGLLVYGTFLFNGLVAPPPFLRPPTAAPENLAAPAPERSALDDTARLPADLGTSGYDVEPGKPTHAPENLATGS